jgi:thioredoxin-related protein
LSRELWWTGSPVVVFEKENQWETVEIPGWFSPGDFVIILKNFLLLLERMRFAKIQNVFQKQLCIKYCCFCKIS